MNARDKSYDESLDTALLDPAFRDRYGNHLVLERVRLYETPNCWADAVREDMGQAA